MTKEQTKSKALIESTVVLPITLAYIIYLIEYVKANNN